MKFGYLVFGVSLNALSAKPTAKFEFVGVIY